MGNEQKETGEAISVNLPGKASSGKILGHQDGRSR